MKSFWKYISLSYYISSNLCTVTGYKHSTKVQMQLLINRKKQSIQSKSVDRLGG